MDDTGNRVTKHDLFVVDAVAADQRYAILIQCLQSAAHNLSQDRRIDTFLRKARDRHRRYWCSGHGPYVVNRVERSDATVVVRVVDDRSEEIERLDQRQVVSQTVYSRVVGCIEADNQIRIKRLFW